MGDVEDTSVGSPGTPPTWTIGPLQNGNLNESRAPFLSLFPWTDERWIPFNNSIQHSRFRVVGRCSSPNFLMNRSIIGPNPSFGCGFNSEPLLLPPATPRFENRRLNTLDLEGFSSSLGVFSTSTFSLKLSSSTIAVMDACMSARLRYLPLA